MLDQRQSEPSPTSKRRFGGSGRLLYAAMLVGCVLTLLNAGCKNGSTEALGSSGAAGETQVRTELFFGLTKPQGADVTEAEFAQFLKDEVTPRFPRGYSVLTAQGHWREQTGRDREEPSRVLVLIHPGGKDAETKIEEIRKVYKTKFAQETVLRADEMEKVSF